MSSPTPRVGFLTPGIGLLILGLIAALLLMAAAPVQAQEPWLAGRVPEPIRGQLDELLSAARDAGLPTEPLIDRALEGSAKGAAPALIVTAVTRLRNELATARQAFGKNASPVEIAAGASALRAGAKETDLTKLRALRADATLTVPSAVLADLVAAGVPADTATSAVLSLAGGADDADYMAFRRNVQRDIALGASPVAALGVRLESLQNTLPGPADINAPITGGRRKQKP